MNHIFTVKKSDNLIDSSRVEFELIKEDDGGVAILANGKTILFIASDNGQLYRIHISRAIRDESLQALSFDEHGYISRDKSEDWD